MTHSWWFSHKTTAFYTEQCTSSLLFHILQSTLNWSLKNYGFICNSILFNSMCMCTNHLATKHNYYSRLMNYKYGWCTWDQTDRISLFHPLLTWCLKEPGQWFFSEYCIHLLRKVMTNAMIIITIVHWCLHAKIHSGGKVMSTVNFCFPSGYHCLLNSKSMVVTWRALLGTSHKLSLMPRPHLSWEKRSGEPSQISWAWSPLRNG